MSFRRKLLCKWIMICCTLSFSLSLPLSRSLSLSCSLFLSLSLAFHRPLSNRSLSFSLSIPPGFTWSRGMSLQLILQMTSAPCFTWTPQRPQTSTWLGELGSYGMLIGHWLRQTVQWHDRKIRFFLCKVYKVYSVAWRKCFSRFICMILMLLATIVINCVCVCVSFVVSRRCTLLLTGSS